MRFEPVKGQEQVEVNITLRKRNSEYSTSEREDIVEYLHKIASIIGDGDHPNSSAFLLYETVKAYD